MGWLALCASALAGPPWPTSADRQVAAGSDIGYPAVAAAPDGRLLVALTHYDAIGGSSVEILRSNIDGEEFLPFGLFWNPDPIISYIQPDLAYADEAGVVVLSMLEQMLGGFRVTVATTPLDGPAQWTAVPAVTGIDLLSPMLVAWEEDEDLELHLLVRSLAVADGGAAPAGLAARAGLAVPAGLAAWYDRGVPYGEQRGEPLLLDQRLLYVRSIDGGASWEDPVILVSLAYPDDMRSPSITVDGAGQVHVVYAAGPEGSRALYYLRHPDHGDPSTPWETPLQLSAATANTRSADIAAGAASPHVLVLHRGDDEHVRAAWSENGGDSFPLLDFIAVNAQEHPSSPRVQALDDEAHMIFRQNGTRLFYRSVPLDDPQQSGLASPISGDGEPVTESFDVTVRTDVGPAAVWLSSSGGLERIPFIDAFWFPPIIGVPEHAVPGVGEGTTGAAFALMTRARPNPFSGSLSMDLDLPQASRAEIGIYDPAGRVIRRLTDRELPAGSHRLTWDGRDGRGRSVAAGVYFLVVRTDRGSSSQRIVRLP